jgi:putative flippase GtrA
VTLRSTTGRFLRFLVAGGLTTVVNFASTALLLKVAGLSVQLSVALAYLVTITTHFTLQRFFVFAGQGEFALSTGSQLRRYLTVAAVQYPLTAGLVALFVAAGLPDLGAVACTQLIVTPVTFVVMRTKLFHAAAGDDEAPVGPSVPVAR